MGLRRDVRIMDGEGFKKFLKRDDRSRSGVQSVWSVLNSTLQEHRNGKAVDKASPEDMNGLLLTFAWQIAVMNASQIHVERAIIL